MSAGAGDAPARSRGLWPSVVDSVASLVFFTLAAGTVERFIAGLDWDQVLTARLAAVPAILLTGRPYGLWRDAILRWSRAADRGPLARTALDVLAFVSFQLPVYVLILLLAGAELEQIVLAAGSAVGVMMLLSRPFGLYLDLARRVAGVAPGR